MAAKLAVRNAEKVTGVAVADFARIRQSKLKGFTINRLMKVLIRLSRDVQVCVSILLHSPNSQNHFQALHT
jgi:hypothetical protein